jgi:hypothetical protein
MEFFSLFIYLVICSMTCNTWLCYGLSVSLKGSCAGSFVFSVVLGGGGGAKVM